MGTPLHTSPPRPLRLGLGEIVQLKILLILRPDTMFIIDRESSSRFLDRPLVAVNFRFSCEYKQNKMAVKLLLILVVLLLLLLLVTPLLRLLLVLAAAATTTTGKGPV